MGIIMSILESENAVINNIEVSSTINKPDSIQKESEYVPVDIKYTAESVPVFIMPQDGKSLFVVECDNLMKLMESQSLNEVDAFEAIRSQLDCTDYAGITFDKMALLVKDENFEQLEEVCKKDKSKVGARTESVMKYTQMLKNIMSEGVNILVDKY